MVRIELGLLCVSFEFGRVSDLGLIWFVLGLNFFDSFRSWFDLDYVCFVITLNFL